ncbi:MAG TPA: 30S ribosome-binding factor RbfA [Pyrinomonadaceae bacterium]|nr:30S ribosome-binding factor RbfA [Pyrinomonadaceae bacterium]
MRRPERLAEALREEIGEVVGFELTDPRLESVVVTDVKVSDDLRDAKVFVIVTGTEKEIAAAMRALQNASVFVRQQVAMNLSLRHVPLLNFARDTAEENAARINEIITTLKNSGELGAEASETE